MVPLLEDVGCSATARLHGIDCPAGSGKEGYLMRMPELHLHSVFPLASYLNDAVWHFKGSLLKRRSIELYLAV